MRRGRGSVIALAGVLIALVSGAGVWAATAPPRGPDPAVKEWPEWPYLTSCGGLSFDPVAAFSGTAEAEKGTRPSEVALRKFLRRGDLPWLYLTRNWRLVAEDETQAEFARGRLYRELEWLWFSKEGGGWRFSSYTSDCDPTSVVGRGPVVTWNLAKPDEPTPNSVVRRIQVNLGPGDCSGGRPQNPRARVVFQEWGEKLLMIVWLRPLRRGPYTCPAIFEPPLKVTLPRRVKLDELWDGATYPPRPAIKRNR